MVAMLTTVAGALLVGMGGGPPLATVLPPTGERVYVVSNHDADGASGTVSVIDPRTMTVVDRIPVRREPQIIYPVPGRNIAYVSHLFGQRLEVLDLVSDSVVQDIRTGLGPRHLAFSPDRRFAYTDDFLGDTVTAIDTVTGRSIGVVPVGHHPDHNVVSTEGRYVFVANNGGSSVSVIDTRVLRVVSTITVGLDPARRPSHPVDLALSPDGSQVVVTGAGDNSLSFISTQTRAELTSVAIGGVRAEVPGEDQNRMLNVRLTPDGAYAWVGNQTSSRWSVVSLVGHRLVAELPGGRGADILFQPLAGPAGGLGLGTARFSDRMTVVDPRHPALLRTIATAPGSHLLTFNQDWTLAFVSCRAGNAVSVIDLRTMTDVRDVPILVPDGIADVWFVLGQAQAHAA
jgi:YVTN family beta-propeller protein